MKHPLSRRLQPLLAIAFLAAVWACDGITGDDTRHSTVQIDVAALRASLGLSASNMVIESVSLEARSPGLTNQYTAQLAPRATTIPPFAVTVNAGTVTFTAEVLSNTEIQDNDFQVEIPLRAVAPLLIVEPDSVDTLIDRGSTFTIRNGGVGQLNWNVTGNPGGVIVAPASGSTTTAPSQVRVVASANAPARFVLDVNSNVGVYRLVVRVVNR
jgi:hypothetical protein